MKEALQRKVVKIFQEALKGADIVGQPITRDLKAKIETLISGHLMGLYQEYGLEASPPVVNVSFSGIEMHISYENNYQAERWFTELIKKMDTGLVSEDHVVLYAWKIPEKANGKSWMFQDYGHTQEHRFFDYRGDRYIGYSTQDLRLGSLDLSETNYRGLGNIEMISEGRPPDHIFICKKKLDGYMGQLELPE